MVGIKWFQNKQFPTCFNIFWNVYNIIQYEVLNRYQISFSETILAMLFDFHFANELFYVANNIHNTQLHKKKTIYLNKEMSKCITEMINDFNNKIFFILVTKDLKSLEIYPAHSIVIFPSFHVISLCPMKGILFKHIASNHLIKISS